MSSPEEPRQQYPMTSTNTQDPFSIRLGNRAPLPTNSSMVGGLGDPTILQRFTQQVTIQQAMECQPQLLPNYPTNPFYTVPSDVYPYPYYLPLEPPHSTAQYRRA